MAKVARRPPGKRRQEPEGKENLDRWLLTYSDMITLLMLFFIILYAMSSLNISKYKAMATAFSSVFSGGDFGLLFDKSNIGTAEQSNDVPQQPAQTTRLKNQSLVFTTAVSRLNELIHQNKVRVVSNEEGVTISLPSDLDFPPGSAQISESYIPVLQKVADYLRGLPNSIRVEGHTDDTPTDGVKYPTNWDLAGARAINVLTVLEAYGVASERLSATSFGQTRPLVSNLTPEGRAYNRRVDIVVVQEPEQLP